MMFQKTCLPYHTKPQPQIGKTGTFIHLLYLISESARYPVSDSYDERKLAAAASNTELLHRHILRVRSLAIEKSRWQIASLGQTVTLS
jgi:hypothetical protein